MVARKPLSATVVATLKEKPKHQKDIHMAH